jgi:DNA-binding HxlR family transcriptional regulator
MSITTNVSGGPGRFVVLAWTIYIDVPPRVDYALIPLGRRVAEAIDPRSTWGTENSAEMASIFVECDALP